MCLEEMLGVGVPEGSLYYDRSRRRRVVTLTAALRETVRETVQRVRDLYTQKTLPEPPADERCPACSLIDACMPAEIHDWAVRSSDPFVIQETP